MSHEAVGVDAVEAEDGKESRERTNPNREPDIYVVRLRHEHPSLPTRDRVVITMSRSHAADLANSIVEQLASPDGRTVSCCYAASVRLAAKETP